MATAAQPRRRRKRASLSLIQISKGGQFERADARHSEVGAVTDRPYSGRRQGGDDASSKVDPSPSPPSLTVATPVDKFPAYSKIAKGKPHDQGSRLRSQSRSSLLFRGL